MTTPDTPGIGHNKADDSAPFALAVDKLRSLVERAERVDSEIEALKSDHKDILIEAKSAGFDTKIIRQLLKLRKRTPSEVQEEEEMLDKYRHALGM
jgi:uncharacterized protein (UPF0335 family)